MPVSAEGRVEHQKRTQTATLGSLEKRKRGVPGTCRAASFLNGSKATELKFRMRKAHTERLTKRTLSFLTAERVAKKFFGKIS